MLWLFAGVSVVQQLVFELHVAIGWPTSAWYLGISVLFVINVWFPLYLYAMVSYAGRWRVFYVFLAGFNMSWFLVDSLLQAFLGVPGVFIGISGGTLLVALVLAIVAALDLRHAAICYPWSHWVGVVVFFGARSLPAAWSLVSLLTGDWS